MKYLRTFCVDFKDGYRLLSIFPCSISLVHLCLFCEIFAFFPTRQWDDQMLSDACRLVLDEIYIPPGAKGGMVEYKRTLIISLLFKFYLKVRRGLNEMVNDFSESLGPLTFWVGVCTWKGFPCLVLISIKGSEYEALLALLCSSPSVLLHYWAEKGIILVFYLPYNLYN